MSKKVLICPLNWGLGHSTRCMPIINELIQCGAEVLLASDGRALSLLKKEYLQLTVLELPTYDIHYNNRFGFMANMVSQVPKFFKAVEQENKEIQRIVDEYEIDIIISDNRFGCLNKNTHNIFITHQVKILLPWQWKLVDPMVFAINTNFIKKFDECWIPDVEGKPNLSGQLAHNKETKNTDFFKFIGPISRLNKIKTEFNYEVLALISGPEPERTNFEELLSKQLKEQAIKALIVRGVTEGTNTIKPLNSVIDIVDFLDSKGIAKAMSAAEIVVSRSGYTTVMDLFKMNKKAIFVPTPGQTEQEMLAVNFKTQKLFYSERQKNFDLANALALSEEYIGPSGVEIDNEILQKTIEKLLGVNN